MEQCQIFLGSRPVGSLKWIRRGDVLHLRAECPFEAERIYRLILQTDGGAVRLGVMLPQGSVFILQKELRCAGTPICALVDRTMPGEEHLPGLPVALSAFQPVTEEDLVRLEQDQHAAQLRSAQWKDTWFYLFALDADESCPFVPFFCLTTAVEYRGRTYGVFCWRDGRCIPLSDSLCADPVLL